MTRFRHTAPIFLALTLLVVGGATALAQQLPGAFTSAPTLDAPILAAPSSGGVFPVFGTAASYTDTYGAPRAGTGWHHGADIFAPKGTPVLAVTDGEIYSVGINTLGGNRLWLRDAAGTTYYYAHLSGYAPGVVDGVRVRAGQVIGFVGNTGQAITTPDHLHFEIHPGDGPSINPDPYLDAWRSGDNAVAEPQEPALGDLPPTGVVVVDIQPATPVLTVPDVESATAVG